MNRAARGLQKSPVLVQGAPELEGVDYLYQSERLQLFIEQLKAQAADAPVGLRAVPAREENEPREDGTPSRRKAKMLRSDVPQGGGSGEIAPERDGTRMKEQ